LNHRVQGQVGGGILGCVFIDRTTLMTSAPTDKSALRRVLRNKRRALTPYQQSHAAKALWQQLKRTREFQRARHIGLYLSADGEISPDIIASKAWTQRRTLYLPVIPAQPGQRLMHFARYYQTTQLVPNRFGIPEPHSWQQCPVQQLDLLLLPLVGFDARGNRLGMGGGFYDTTLHSLLDRPLPRPAIIGLAHHCQQVTQLQSDSWDIPLDAVITDRRLFRCQQQR